jgi:cob(I)alamin adenosyltransferase
MTGRFVEDMDLGAVLPTVAFSFMALTCWAALRHVATTTPVNSALAKRMAARGPLASANRVVTEPNEKERLLPSDVVKAHDAAVAKGEEMYTDPSTGLLVFTRVAHLNRGRCCGSHCRHCPYGHINVPSKSQSTVTVPASDPEATGNTHRASVYTKTGDRGTSSLFTGERRSKTDAVFDALGAVDELNCHVGVALAALSIPGVAQPRSLAQQLDDIQRKLLDVGSIVATPDRNKVAELGFQPQLWTDELERAIDTLDASLPPLNVFILPGGTEASARLHVCRSVCRRAERELIRVKETLPRETLTKELLEALRFVNRLSDFFFVAARSTDTSPDRRRT